MSAVERVNNMTTLSRAEMVWVPSGPGKTFRPLRFWETGWSELMRVEPGVEVSLHRHSGPVDSLVVEGQRLLSNGEILGPGGYQYEPEGTVDSWATTGTEACVVYLRIEGDVEYLDPNGEVTGVVNSGTQSALYEKWCDANHVEAHFRVSPTPDALRAFEVSTYSLGRRVSNEQ